MRISDWSSDVCSSDLELLVAGAPVRAHWVADRQSGPLILKFGTEQQRLEYLPRIARGECYFCIGMSEADSGSDLASIRPRAEQVPGGWRITGSTMRQEEHTSELQSLMPISYAVF